MKSQLQVKVLHSKEYLSLIKKTTKVAHDWGKMYSYLIVYTYRCIKTQHFNVAGGSKTSCANLSYKNVKN